MLQRAAIVLVIGFVCLRPLRPPVAKACAAAWGNRHEPVVIVDESAIILWDAAQKVQHFIRWARFEAAAPDFGFLVPTPTQPELTEVDESIFARMEQWTKPKVVTNNELNFEPMFCIFGCGMNAEMRPPPDGVRVLDRQIVGGMDAAVLEADSAEALRQWLDKNGYAARSELIAWLAPYVADKWKITAFKVVQQPGGAAVQTAPVRMSFRADRPFFPYREPDERKEPTRRNPKRLLRVYFVGDQRVAGSLGSAEWSARVPWSNVLDEARQTELAQALGFDNQRLPVGARLTVFEDSSSPRTGTDEVWFETDTNQATVVPPDQIVRYRIWVPIDVLFLGVIVLGLVIRVARRGRVQPTT